MRQLIKELIRLERRRNSLLAEISKSLEKIANRENKKYEHGVGKSAF